MTAYLWVAQFRWRVIPSTLAYYITDETPPAETARRRRSTRHPYYGRSVPSDVIM